MSVTEQPSQHEANKMVRVLTSAEPLKYTVRIHLPDRRVIEYQSDSRPDTKFNQEARSLWVYNGGYEGYPICELVPSSIILCEENPNHKGKS